MAATGKQEAHRMIGLVVCFLVAALAATFVLEGPLAEQRRER